MTKVYLVTREMTDKGNVTNYVSSVFTNLKKAQSLVRYFNAQDEEDKRKYPNLYASLKPKTKIVPFNIDNFDYSKAAIEKEIKNLPF